MTHSPARALSHARHRFDKTPTRGLLGRSRLGWLVASIAALATALGITLATQTGASAATETFFPDTTVPRTLADPDTNAVELGLRFSVTVPGTVVGVRYYGTRANTGTHTGTLWSSTGRRLATATFPSSRGSGWKTVSFGTPVRVSPGTSYTVSYFAPTGRYAADNWAFTSPRTRGHISIPRDAGVYRYGRNGGVPREVWRSSNYYVDVRFVPDGVTTTPTTTPTTPTSTPTTPTTSPSSTGSPTATPTTPTQTPTTPTTTPTTPTSTPTTPTTSPSTTTPTSTASPTTGCAPVPSRCGYPDASNTGVSAGAPLRTVSGGVRITQDGTVFENAIVGSIDIEADNVTIRNVRVTGTGEGWGIGMRATKNTTIENVEILPDGPRLLVGIKDVTGTSSGTHIRKTEIARTTTGIQVHEGLIEDNYIHDMGFKQGDHLNGTTSNGSTVPMTIRHNTIFNQYGQTDAVSLFQDFGPEGNRTITDNLLAGGGYTIYAGGQGPTPTFNIKITNNRISRIFFPNGGSYGPLAKWENGTGNEWSGNIWDDTGAPVSR
jgi:hypothetical protein